MDAIQQPALLGNGLAISAGDLVMRNGDFVEISGAGNFLQGMQVMIETPFGSDIFNTGYGFDTVAILSQSQPPGFLKELIRLNIVKSLTTDNRIREIREIAFSDDPRFAELAPGTDPDTALLSAKRDRRWGAVIVLHTIAGIETALNLQGQGA